MKKRVWLELFLIAFFIFFDRLSKFLVSSKLTLFKTYGMFTYVINRGAGFGILQNKSFYLGIFNFIMVGLIVFFYQKYYKNKTLLSTFTYSLLVAGALSNGYDRIVYGYVVDFINWRVWPIFNLADSFVVASAVGAVIIVLWKKY
jgi:signal peptidase II